MNSCLFSKDILKWPNQNDWYLLKVVKSDRKQVDSSDILSTLVFSITIPGSFLT